MILVCAFYCFHLPTCSYNISVPAYLTKFFAFVNYFESTYFLCPMFLTPLIWAPLISFVLCFCMFYEIFL